MAEGGVQTEANKDHMESDAALVLFARAPAPGETKTRLIPALGAEGAAELYRCFLLDALASASEAPAAVMVAASDPNQMEAVRALAAEGCPRAVVTAQSGGDLGARMAHAFREAFAQGHQRVVILGTDLPGLPPERVRQALELLRERRLVLGPCEDGGYYLIGLRALLPQLFEQMEWGGDTVLADTRRRAESLGVSVALLDPWSDVDTPQDLEALRAHLAARSRAGEPISCPRTWRHLCQETRG